METQASFSPAPPPPPPSADFFSNPEFKAMLRNELSDLLADFIATQEKRAGDVSLIERIVRVEEAQRSHEELTRTMLGQINLQFDSVDKRFDSVDKRFDSVDKRIDSVDKRFEEMARRLDRFMFWSLGLTVSATFLIITMLR
jgi:chromosome segregation ATPase